MDITIVGAGYVGLVTGACFADFGFKVFCVDKNSTKVNMLKKGIKAESLVFGTDLSEFIKNSSVVIIAVGTPVSLNDGHVDLSYVYDAVKEIAKKITSYTVIVTKSTVPVGTSRKIAEIIKEVKHNLIEGEHFSVVSNPEFLREGSAINDFMRPDRIIIGTNNEKAKIVLQHLYRPLFLKKTPIIFTNIETAELIKYASNSFLALKISFINQMADLCEKTGCDVQELAHGMGLDKRIGSKFLNVGPGYGGSCFPKDTLALSKSAHQAGVSCSLVDAVIDYKNQRKIEMAQRIIRVLNGNIVNKIVAILGITFKPNTDDLRDAPSLTIISELLKHGINVRIFDPLYNANCKCLGLDNSMDERLREVVWSKSPYDAAKKADCLVILTEWNEFRALNLKKILSLMKKSHRKKPIFMDFRNIYKLHEMNDFDYHSLGRCVS